MMKGIGTLLFGIAMILTAIFSAVMFYLSESYFFAVLLAIAGFVGFLASLCGLAQVYERPKPKDSQEESEATKQDEAPNESDHV